MDGKNIRKTRTSGCQFKGGLDRTRYRRNKGGIRKGIYNQAGPRGIVERAESSRRGAQAILEQGGETIFLGMNT